MSDVCHLRLANGWSVSISSEDLAPAICSIIAWPTWQDDVPMRDARLFEFGPGRNECRCHSLAAIREALSLVADAASPIGDRSVGDEIYQALLDRKFS